MSSSLEAQEKNTMSNKESKSLLIGKFVLGY